MTVCKLKEAFSDSEAQYEEESGSDLWKEELGSGFVRAESDEQSGVEEEVGSGSGRAESDEQSGLEEEVGSGSGLAESDRQFGREEEVGHGSLEEEDKEVNVEVFDVCVFILKENLFIGRNWKKKVRVFEWLICI